MSSPPPPPTSVIPSRDRLGLDRDATTSEDSSSTAAAAAAAGSVVPDDYQSSAPDLPMSMTASMIMTHLPKDTTQALKEIERTDDFKVSVRFSALPSAPALGKQRVFKISASQRFETVVNFLRKRLGVKEHEALFCYVNSVFAPGLDEGVGNLFRGFKTDDQLNVMYSMTPAFG